MYQEDKEYNVIKGIVPDFGYDVKLAITVDGQGNQKNIPESNETKEEKYYRVGVSCSNEVKGEWDYNAWNLKLDNVIEGTKCNLTFTSNMSKEEHDNIIEEGVSLRRNTYRGKDITGYYNGETINGRNLYDQIGNCTFDDIYVGDYIKTDTNGKNVTWLIADLNNYLHTGDTDITSNTYPKQEGEGLKTCHATIIPAEPLENAKMNTSDTTGVVNDVTSEMPGYGKGAYYGSYMKNVTLPKILTEYIKPVFGNHIIKTRNLLTDKMNGSLYNQYGSNTGASSHWDWYDSEIDLMSEVNVYGTTVWSSSGYDIGVDNRQYAIFDLKPELINSYNDIRFIWWLKAVTSSTGFALIHRHGDASYTNNIASNSYGVRPRFLID